jgi:TolB-like protein
MLADAADQVGALEGQSPPSAEEVRAQLERFACSPEFSVSARDSNFLRYVVEETLAGRGDRIKAYSIATEVFGRDHTFDAQNDPVVRIEAGRLRRALERYYLLAGHHDPILIEVPKGGYVPTFTRAALLQETQRPEAAATPSRSRDRDRAVWLAYGIVCGLLLVVIPLAASKGFVASSLPTPPARAAGTLARPMVEVVPFADLGDGPGSRLHAAGLSEEVLSQIARLSGLTVVGPGNSLGPGIDLGRRRGEAGIRYAIEGSVRTSGRRLRVTARLLDAEIGAVLWSQAYDEDLEARDVLTIQDDVAQKVAIAIGSPDGAIFRANDRPPAPQGSAGR